MFVKNNKVNLWLNSANGYIRCNMYILETNNTLTKVINDTNLSNESFDTLSTVGTINISSDYYISILLAKQDNNNTNIHTINFSVNISTNTLNTGLLSTNIISFTGLIVNSLDTYFDPRLGNIFTVLTLNNNGSISHTYLEYTLQAAGYISDNIYSSSFTLDSNYSIFNTKYLTSVNNTAQDGIITLLCLNLTNYELRLYVSKISLSFPRVNFTSSVLSNKTYDYTNSVNPQFYKPHMATNNNRLAGQVYLGSTNSLEIYNISISGQNPTITLVNSTPSVVTSFFNFIMGLCYVKDNILGLLTYTHHGTFTNNDPEKFGVAPFLIKYIKLENNSAYDTNLHYISSYNVINLFGLSAYIFIHYNTENNVLVINIPIDNTSNSYLTLPLIVVNPDVYSQKSYIDTIVGMTDISGGTGTTGQVSMHGSINNKQTDLTIGSKYYKDAFSNTLTIVATDFSVGTAISNTELQLNTVSNSPILRSNGGFIIGDNIYNKYNSSLIIGSDLSNVRHGNILIDLRENIVNDSQYLIIPNLGTLLNSTYLTAGTTGIYNIHYDQLSGQIYKSLTSTEFCHFKKVPNSSEFEYNWYKNKEMYNNNWVLATISGLANKVAHLIFNMSANNQTYQTVQEVPLLLEVSDTYNKNQNIRSTILNFNNCLNQTITIPVRMDETSACYIKIPTTITATVNGVTMSGQAPGLVTIQPADRFNLYIQVAGYLD